MLGTGLSNLDLQPQRHQIQSGAQKNPVPKPSNKHGYSDLNSFPQDRRNFPVTTSMTAFARSESALDGNRLTWEIRSVNHRYLDVNVKLPEDFRGLEDVIRRKLAESLGRGRIDAHLKVEITEKTIEFVRFVSLVGDHGWKSG